MLSEYTRKEIKPSRLEELRSDWRKALEAARVRRILELEAELDELWAQ